MICHIMRQKGDLIYSFLFISKMSSAVKSDFKGMLSQGVKINFFFFLCGHSEDRKRLCL